MLPSITSVPKEFGFTMHGGMMLNILNSKALEQYEGLGLADACLSFELPFTEMRDLLAAAPEGMDTGAAVYGRLPLMKLRACPVKASMGSCAGCHGRSVLTDRIGEQFPIICREKQYSELLNCVPLYAGDRSIPPVSSGLLYFTIETKEECKEAFDAYMNKAEFPGRKTAGLYFRKLL